MTASRRSTFVVGKLGDRTAHGRVHPPGASRQEYPSCGARVGRRRPASPAQSSRPVPGVGALADLGQLLGIAEEQEIVGSRGDRDRIGEAILAGLLDDHKSRAAWRHPAGIGEIPCGAADHEPPPASMKAG